MSGTKFVLVVEDDDEIRSLIVSALKAESQDIGLVVVEARDGREAIQFAGRQEFHCVVTDLNMPRTNGRELIKTLLGDALNANTPTVVVSAALDESFLENFKNVRTISKPFDPQMLSQTIMREIKLGRMDERVPAHLLNPFVDSLRTFLTRDAGFSADAIQVQAPFVRKAGDKFEGDFHAILTLTTGMSQARVALTFDRDFLLRMKSDYFPSRRSQWAAMNMELLTRHTCQALIESMLEELVAIFGHSPRIAELAFYDFSDEAKRLEASKVSSISIAVGTDQGRVFVSALAPARAKRGQA